tara:strand:- start:18661 stop:18903 length:243 start_codon:yes stop_codon:yes gene_type:complete
VTPNELAANPPQPLDVQRVASVHVIKKHVMELVELVDFISGSPKEQHGVRFDFWCGEHPYGCSFRAVYGHSAPYDERVVV